MQKQQDYTRQKVKVTGPRSRQHKPQGQSSTLDPTKRLKIEAFVNKNGTKCARSDTVQKPSNTGSVVLSPILIRREGHGVKGQGH